MVSRVLGFARDMIGGARAGRERTPTTPSILAFLLPNIFRRLFARRRVLGRASCRCSAGASRRAGRRRRRHSRTRSCRCSCRRCCWSRSSSKSSCRASLLLVAGEYQKVPGKLELAVELTRLTFPYLLFISLVALLSGVLNSLTRFAVAAFAPALLNVALIVALLVAPRPTRSKPCATWRSRCSLGGILQFACCAGSRCARPASSSTSAARG